MNRKLSNPILLVRHYNCILDPQYAYRRLALRITIPMFLSAASLQMKHLGMGWISVGLVWIFLSCWIP